MFHPQPTPLASSSYFVPGSQSNGIGLALGFGIPPPPVRDKAKRTARSEATTAAAAAVAAAAGAATAATAAASAGEAGIAAGPIPAGGLQGPGSGPAGLSPTTALHPAPRRSGTSISTTSSSRGSGSNCISGSSNSSSSPNGGISSSSPPGSGHSQAAPAPPSLAAPPSQAQVQSAGSAGDAGLCYLFGPGSSAISSASSSRRQSSSPFQYRHTYFSQQHTLRPRHHHFTLLAAPAITTTTAAAMDDQTSNRHDVAAQQEAARDYQPILEGPLVGDKTPSDAITHEYAKADQVYVEKTLALPQTYSHYRPIQGDGNCGWRAIGFSYFEKLVESGDQGKIEGEVARLISLNPMLSNVGGYTYFEDWVDEMTGLLRELAANVVNPVAVHTLLLQRWNDVSVEGCLIYYLRLLAATYLKANASTYDPFVPDGRGVASYCSQSVELPNREIEHLGIVALVNVLLKPADFVLEIAYLDRSPGSQVNHHRFTDESDGQTLSLDAATIHLLYRPDHYDILYRSAETVPPNDLPTPVNMQVNRVSSLSNDAQISGTSTSLGAFATLDFGALAMLPGFGGVSAMPSLGLPPATASPPGSQGFLPTQHSPWAPPYAEEPGPNAAQSHTSSSLSQVHSPTAPTLGPSSPIASLPSLMPTGVPMDGQKPSPLIQTAGVASAAGYPIRFSPVQLDYDESKSNFRESSFQVKTNTFKNSVWNRAHYGNPDFHPEEWSPEEENGDGRITGKRRARKDRDS